MRKIVIVGDSDVGKTSIIKRFVFNSTPGKEKATIGAAEFNKVVQLNHVGLDINFIIWDCSGQERFRSISSVYYRDADGVILVYDITNQKSFDHINEWY